MKNLFRKNSTSVCIFTLLILLSANCKNRATIATLPADDKSNGGLREVRTIVVAAQESNDVITATGTTAPLSNTVISPLVSGKLQYMPVKEGDVVRQGQILGVLDQRSFKLMLRQAETSVEAARIGLDAAKREKDRFEKLLQQDATARAQYDQIKDRFNGAEVQLKQAQVAVDQAKKALSDTTLTAPYNGVVVKKIASVGDFLTTMPPAPLLSMVDIHLVELRVSLPEPELPRVDAGTPVEVEIPSLKTTITTKINRIVRNVDVMTRSFQVICELANSDMKLKGGLFAKVRILSNKPRMHLLVPSEAVIDESNGIYSVLIAEGTVVRRREVQATTAEGSNMEILSGLKVGETLVLDNSGLTDGDQVKPQPIAPSKTAEARP